MNKKYFCKHCGRVILNSNHGTDYCRKHEYQLKKYGKFLDNIQTVLTSSVNAQSLFPSCFFALE
jgi:hypothetical protein